MMMNLLAGTVAYVAGTLLHNAPYLALGIVTAAVLKVYVDPERMRQWLLSHTRVSIPASVAFGALTPFCACGTMAVVLSLLATALPWGPIMAFLVSSPLMSPDEFIFYSGVLGLRFAVALTLASIAIGLGGGYLAHLLQSMTGYLDNQLRFAPVVATAAAASSSCGCSESAPMREITDAEAVVPEACGCGSQPENNSSPSSACGCSESNPPAQGANRIRWKELLREVTDIGVRKVLLYFSLFAAIGYFVNQLVPAEFVMSLFNGSHWYAVPLAALIGLPLYITGASALPLLQVLLNAGASAGAVLAFLITGPATSVGVIAGISTIMKRKAIALYVAIILCGGILAGYGYDLVLQFMA